MDAKQWLKRVRNMQGRLRALQECKNCAILSAEVDKQKEQLELVRAEVLHAICQVEDGMLVRLLTEYYVNGKTWEEIALEIGYSVRQITRLHNKALQQIQRIIA